MLEKKSLVDEIVSLTLLTAKFSDFSVSGISCSGRVICGCTVCLNPSKTPLKVNFFIFEQTFSDQDLRVRFLDDYPPLTCICSLPTIVHLFISIEFKLISAFNSQLNNIFYLYFYFFLLLCSYLFIYLFIVN